MALDCEEKLTLAKNTLQAVSSVPSPHTCANVRVMLGGYRRIGHDNQQYVSYWSVALWTQTYLTNSSLSFLVNN